MPTAQQLIDLSTALTAVVESINAIVGAKPLPYDAATNNLSYAGAQIAAKANAIGQAGLAALAHDVQGAIGQLTAQVTAANVSLKKLDEVKKAFNIANVVLTDAASIATSVATGNWVGTASAVFTLARDLQTAIDSNKPAASTSGA